MSGMARGQFRIVERLGAGGMGEVSRAVDELLKRDVALKMLRSDLASEPEIVVRFRAEAVTLARLDHPNIARLYGMSQDDDALFMVMEFVPGETLATSIRRRGRIPWSETVALMGQVLDAVEYAHKLDIVHRDLKPANIILRPDGVVKVTDFGIARVLGTERATRKGQTVGTFLYMSPEQIRGEDVTPRSDLYSLGIVFYELLAGHPPYRGTETELIRQHLTAPVPSLASLAGDVPLSFASVLHQTLAKSPAERFSSAGLFRAELDRIARVARRPAPGPTRLAPAAPAPTRLASPAQVLETPPTRLAEEPGAGPKPPDITAPALKRRSGLSVRHATIAGASVLIVVVVTIAVFRAGLPRAVPSPITGAQNTPANATDTNLVAAPPQSRALEPLPSPTTTTPRPEPPATRTGPTTPRPEPPALQPPLRDPASPTRVPLEPPAISEPTTPTSPPDVAVPPKPRPAFPNEEIGDVVLIVTKDDESTELEVLLRLTGDSLIVYDPDLEKAVKTWPYSQITKATYTQTLYRRPPLFITKALRYFLTLGTAGDSVKLRLSKDSLAKALPEIEQRCGLKVTRTE